MTTVVYLGEKDPEAAIDKAERIYDMLGEEFFIGLGRLSQEQIIGWIYRTLRNDALRVEFNDPQDAMLFKLTFGGA